MNALRVGVALDDAVQRAPEQQPALVDRRPGCAGRGSRASRTRPASARQRSAASIASSRADRLHAAFDMPRSFGAGRVRRPWRRARAPARAAPASRSTATIRSQPAAAAAITADSPTAPQPNTASELPLGPQHVAHRAGAGLHAAPEWPPAAPGRRASRAPRCAREAIACVANDDCPQEAAVHVAQRAAAVGARARVVERVEALAVGGPADRARAHAPQLSKLSTTRSPTASAVDPRLDRHDAGALVAEHRRQRQVHLPSIAPRSVWQTPVAAQLDQHLAVARRVDLDLLERHRSRRSRAAPRRSPSCARRYGPAHATGTAGRGAGAGAGRHRAGPVHRDDARRHGRRRAARRAQGRRRAAVPGASSTRRGAAAATIAVDLKHPEGVELVLSLAEKADALIEGYRPGVLERLGLGPERGPRAQPAARLRAHDRLRPGRADGAGRRARHQLHLARRARSARCARTGERPLFPLNLVGDYGGGGMLLAFGVVCAPARGARRPARARWSTRRWSRARALLTTLFHGLRRAGGWNDEPGTNLLDSGAHFYEVYETSDGGHVAVGAIEPQFYARLLELLELDPDDFPQFDNARWPEFKERFAEVFATKTRAEWAALLEGEEACATAVYAFADAARAPAQPGPRHLRRARRHAPARRRAALRPHPRRGPPAPRRRPTPRSPSGATTTSTPYATRAPWPSDAPPRAPRSGRGSAGRRPCRGSAGGARRAAGLRRRSPRARAGRAGPAPASANLALRRARRRSRRRRTCSRRTRGRSPSRWTGASATARSARRRRPRARAPAWSCGATGPRDYYAAIFDDEQQALVHRAAPRRRRRGARPHRRPGAARAPVRLTLRAPPPSG